MSFKAVVELSFRKTTELEVLIYTALVKVGFWHCKCVLKAIYRSKWPVSSADMMEWTAYNVEQNRV